VYDEVGGTEGAVVVGLAWVQGRKGCGMCCVQDGLEDTRLGLVGLIGFATYVHASWTGTWDL
jgi:hypothetical protein